MRALALALFLLAPTVLAQEPGFDDPDDGPARAGAIHATLSAPLTYYTVIARGGGGVVDYQWSKSDPCGGWTPGGPTATWDHSDRAGCAHGSASHPATITVSIYFEDGTRLERTYEGGSNTGVGTIPPPVETEPEPCDDEAAAPGIVIAGIWQEQHASGAVVAVMGVNLADVRLQRSVDVLVVPNGTEPGRVLGRVTFDLAGGEEGVQRVPVTNLTEAALVHAGEGEGILFPPYGPSSASDEAPPSPHLGPLHLDRARRGWIGTDEWGLRVQNNGTERGTRTFQIAVELDGGVLWNLASLTFTLDPGEARTQWFAWEPVHPSRQTLVVVADGERVLWDSWVMDEAGDLMLRLRSIKGFGEIPATGRGEAATITVTADPPVVETTTNVTVHHESGKAWVERVAIARNGTGSFRLHEEAYPDTGNYTIAKDNLLLRAYVAPPRQGTQPWLRIACAALGFPPGFLDGSVFDGVLDAEGEARAPMPPLLALAGLAVAALALRRRPGRPSTSA